MKPLQEALNKIDGYLLSLERDVMKGQYELKVGIPKNWVYESTDNVECEVLKSTKQGDLVKIFSIKEDIVIDDLIEFINIIIDTNQQIAEMEKKHKEEQDDAILKMEEEEVAFKEKIVTMAKNSFESMQKEQKNIGSKTKKEVTVKEDTVKEDTVKEDLRDKIESKLSN
jgi:hypothetical protein